MSAELVPTTVTAEQIALIKNTVAQGATDAELKLFLFDCQRQGVHPLDRLIHFSKRGGKYTPITSIDFARSRASDSGELAGSDEPQFQYEEGNLLPVSCKVTVYRITQGQRYAYTATAMMSEYHPGEGAPGFMWRKMPHAMLAKVCEMLALRKAFPRQLAGVYSKEEMDQAGRDESAAEVVDQKIKALHAPAARAPEAAPESPAPPAAPPPEAPYQDEDLGLRNKLRARFFAMLHDMVKSGMQDSVVIANSEKGRERRRGLLKTLLEATTAPEPNQMTAAQWKTVNGKLEGFLRELRVAQEEPGDPGPESEPPPGVAA